MISVIFTSFPRVQNVYILCTAFPFIRKTSQLCQLDNTVKKLKDTSTTLRKEISSSRAQLAKSKSKQNELNKINEKIETKSKTSKKKYEILVVDDNKDKEGEEDGEEDSSYFENQSEDRDSNDQIYEENNDDIMRRNLEKSGFGSGSSKDEIEKILEKEERQQLEFELKKWQSRLEEAKNVLENTPESLEEVLSNYYQKLNERRNSDDDDDDDGMNHTQRYQKRIRKKKKNPLKIFEERNLITEWKLEDMEVVFKPTDQTPLRTSSASSQSANHSPSSKQNNNIGSRRGSPSSTSRNKDRRNSIGSMTSEKSLEQEDEEYAVELSVELLEERLRKRAQILDDMNSRTQNNGKKKVSMKSSKKMNRDDMKKRQEQLISQDDSNMIMEFSKMSHSNSNNYEREARPPRLLKSIDGVSNNKGQHIRYSLSAGAIPLSSSLSYEQKDNVIKRSKECLRHAPVKLQVN